MKLTACPWKTAWHEEQVSDRFFQELAKMEKGLAKDLNTSAQWLEHLVIELGQLAQNMVQLESEDPHVPQLRMAYDRAIKLSALSVHLAVALHDAEDGLGQAKGKDDANYHPSVASAVEAATHQAEAGGMSAATSGKPAPSPMRQTILSLAKRGVPVPEIEVITGQPRNLIESVLSEE